MTREEKLLILCSCVDMQADSSKALRKLSDTSPNWEYLIELSLFHRVFPLLYKNIQKHKPDTLPPTALKQLKNVCMQNGTRNLFLVSSLLSVLNCFEKHGIQALPFKGPTLTENIYGDIGLRSFCDLDILVSRSDLGRAVQILQAEGFYPDIDLNQEQFLKLVDKGHHATLMKGAAIVELHWELTGRYFSKKTTLESVLPRIKTINLAGKSIQTLGDEDLLVYLCIHGCRHHWVQLDSVCCVAELIKKKTTLNWKIVFQLATEQGALKMTLLGILLAQKLLNLVVPAEVEKEIKQHLKLESIASRIAKKMLLNPVESQQLMPYKEYVLFHHAIMDKRVDWLMYCIRPLFNTTHSDWEWVCLPAPLSFLYYILRPLRLVNKYSIKLFRN